MSEIRMNYTDVINKAKRIKQLSEKVAGIRKKIEKVNNETRSYWQGEASDTYRMKCEELEGKVENTKRKMSALSDAIVKAANAIKAADDANRARAGRLGR